MQQKKERKNKTKKIAAARAKFNFQLSRQTWVKIAFCVATTEAIGLRTSPSKSL